MVLKSRLTKEEELILSFVESVYKKVMAEYKVDFTQKPQERNKHLLDDWLGKRYFDIHRGRMLNSYLQDCNVYDAIGMAGLGNAEHRRKCSRTSCQGGVDARGPPSCAAATGSV